MKERRASPRNRCSISLKYSILNDQEYRELLESFDEKRDRVVLFDELEYKNHIVKQSLDGLSNKLAPILHGINEQLLALTKTLAMDFDRLQRQHDSDVIINAGGMLLQTIERLKSGSIIELQLKLSPEMPRLLIVAEVLRCEKIKHHDKFTTAIAFTYIEPEDKVALLEFVEHHANDYRNIS